jgi:hypothetical protein
MPSAKKTGNKKEKIQNTLLISIHNVCFTLQLIPRSHLTNVPEDILVYKGGTQSFEFDRTRSLQIKFADIDAKIGPLYLRTEGQFYRSNDSTLVIPMGDTRSAVHINNVRKVENSACLSPEGITVFVERDRISKLDLLA